MKDSTRIVSSSMAFSMAWLTISFAFPLLGVRYSLNYTEIGIIGMVSNLSFGIASASYLKAGSSVIRISLRMIPFLSAMATLLFLFSTKSTFAYVIGIVSIVQAFFWISMEIYLGYASGTGNAEKYTASWGFPMAFAPILAGAMIQYLGFRPLFIVGIVFFALAGFLAPNPKEYLAKDHGEKPSVIMILPLVFSGIAIGFFFYVIVPYLKLHGYSYVDIAVIETLFAGIQALVFFLLNFVRRIRVTIYALITAIMSASPLILLVSLSIYLIIPFVIVIAVASAIGFSKILSYISATTSPNTGVFYYETFYAIGFAIGSSVGGSLFELNHSISYLIFIMPFVYSFILVPRMKHKVPDLAC
ncbi:hypothetical membrane protein [Thermoplasma acidophilum]|uniref:Hypothetical membrane protein n=1 Tax=Thermoplasma acidophilum (strain ATCC 25905 / DSM 1728 / JCM 9062 / NBRC 15155 / AMRC-C165) TaxID=273075 RepID=Q9HIK6_THEAC|nr:MFS transporter [Thermoplasma acidophilum]CAC12454.1 hypothetical membrane protein [Thermoplasma acidophilum]